MPPWTIPVASPRNAGQPCPAGQTARLNRPHHHHVRADRAREHDPHRSAIDSAAGPAGSSVDSGPEPAEARRPADPIPQRGPYTDQPSVAVSMARDQALMSLKGGVL